MCYRIYITNLLCDSVLAQKLEKAEKIWKFDKKKEGVTAAEINVLLGPWGPFVRI